MKKEYLKPEMMTVKLQSQQVICTSKGASVLHGSVKAEYDLDWVTEGLDEDDM